MRIIIFLLFIPISIFSIEFIETESDNFIFKTEKGVNINNYINTTEEINKSIDNLLKLKNNNKLRTIYILNSLESYKTYLEEFKILNRSDYVYIEFNKSHSVIIIYESDNFLEENFRHHLAMQYIDKYSLNTPYWLKNALSTYLEGNYNNSWIDVAKKSSNVKNIVSTLLKSSVKEDSEFYGLATISYLINTEIKEHNRLLWDILSYIKYNNKENYNYINKSILDSNLDSYVYNYLMDIKGYEDYIVLGINEFNSGNYNEAISNFNNAIDINSKLYTPYYYLGLCNNKLGYFDKAYSNFSTSIDNGAPKDKVFYSIGINFYEKKDYKEAIKYLKKITDATYSVLAKEVVNEIEKY